MRRTMLVMPVEVLLPAVVPMEEQVSATTVIVVVREQRIIVPMVLPTSSPRINPVLSIAGCVVVTKVIVTVARSDE